MNESNQNHFYRRRKIYFLSHSINFVFSARPYDTLESDNKRLLTTKLFSSEEMREWDTDFLNVN